MARQIESNATSRRSADWNDEPRRSTRKEVESEPARGRGRPRKEVEPEPIVTRRGRPAREPEPVVTTRRARQVEVVEEPARGRGRPRKEVEPEPARGRGRKVVEVQEPEEYTPREGSAAQIAIDLLSTKAARKSGVDFEDVMEALGYDPKYNNHRVSARVVLYKLKAKGFDVENVGEYGRPAYRINN